jgi:hypothetical protein
MLDGGEQLIAVVIAEVHVGLAQRAGGGLDAGQRGAQVVPDRAQQRGPQPVDLGKLASVGRFSGEVTDVDCAAGCVREVAQQATVLREQPRTR